MEELQHLLDTVLLYDPGADIGLLSRTYELADKAHEGQKRISGEPYITHPIAVASILTDIEMDTASICAALLHDVVEDTNYTFEDILNEFGSEIALLVDGVTKLNRLNFKTREDEQAENLRKMFMAMAKDIRVLLIKLADRLHNMRTLNYHNEKKQQVVARETMEIFAPLAHRLGIFKFKWELEDLAFYYLDNNMYREIASRLKKKRKEREDYVNELISQLEDGLDKAGIRAEIKGRPKNIYSIYKKMIKQNKDVDEIYDKIAIRVIVDDIWVCYGVLGVIHTMWTPLPGRFKDYIATPKPNMYQSLHTTVIGKGGEPFEIQVRTMEMHKTAEYGIAAHWRYKEGEGERAYDKKLDEKLSWLRSILEWQQDINDTGEFMESLKIDLFDDSVYVFTPKSDVFELPKGSCPVDFAYRVHTEIGHRCTGARVNARIVPLDFQLNNGDIVEIITSKNSPGPSWDWLNFVKTSSAKSRIKGWFKKEKRRSNILKGHDLLEQEMKKRRLVPKELLKEGKLLDIVKRFSLTSVDDLFAAVGDGTITVNQVINKQKELYFHDAQVEDIVILPAQSKTQPDRDTSALRIKGVDGVMIRLARCCNPLPGDEVLGYITRGRGVSVHRLDCPNMLYYLDNEKDRTIEVEWADEKGIYSVELEVKAIDRPRLTADVMLEINDTRVHITSVFSRVTKKDWVIMNFKIEIKDMGHLQAVMQRIQKVKDVHEVRRVLPGEVRSD